MYQGRMDEAFELLERAYDERDGLLFLYKYYPVFDAYRGDGRFDDILNKMGFDK